MLEKEFIISKAETRTVARQRWHRIFTRIRKCCNTVNKLFFKNELRNGIYFQHITDVPSRYVPKQVLRIQDKVCLLHNHKLTVIAKGKLRKGEMYTMDVPWMTLSKLNFANLLIGWTPQKNILHLLDGNMLKLIHWELTPDSRLLSVIPNNARREFYTVELCQRKVLLRTWRLQVTPWGVMSTAVRVIWPLDAPGRLTSQDETTDLWCLLCFTPEGALAQSRTFLASTGSAATLIVSWGEGAWKLPLESHNAALCYGGRDLHRANITAVLFYKPTAAVITADSTGTIKTWTSEFQALGCYEPPMPGSAISFIWPHPLSIAEGELASPPAWNTFLPASFLTASTDGLLQSWLLPNTADSTPDNLAPTELSVKELPRFRVPLLHRGPLYIYEADVATNDILVASCAPSISRIYEIRTEQNFTPVSRLPGRIKSMELVCVTSDYLNGHFGLQVGKSDDVAITLAVCEGHPSSVHMCLAYSGTPFCFAVSKQAIQQAIWDWSSDRLFVLHEDGSVAAFSTRRSPCLYLVTVLPDIKEISSLPVNLTRTPPIWPIVLLRATAGKQLRISGSSLVVCQSDGNLAHVCTDGGGILTVAVGPVDACNQEAQQLDSEITGVHTDHQLAPSSVACLTKFSNKEEYLSVDTTGAIRFWVASHDGARSIRRHTYVPSLRPVNDKTVLRPRMFSSKGITQPTCISHLAASGRYVMVVGAKDGDEIFPVIICDTLDGSQLDHPASEAHVQPIVDVTSVQVRAPKSDTGGTQVLFATIAPNDKKGSLRIWTPEFHEIIAPDLFSIRSACDTKKAIRSGVCRLLMKISIPDSVQLSAVRFLNCWGDLVLAWGKNICILPWQTFMPRFLHKSLLLQATFGKHSDADLVALNRSKHYHHAVPTPIPFYSTDQLRNAPDHEPFLVKSPSSWGPSPAGYFTEPARPCDYDWSESVEAEYRLSLQNLIAVRDDLVALMSPVVRSTKSAASRSDTSTFESIFQTYLGKVYAVPYGLSPKCITGIARKDWSLMEDENNKTEPREIDVLRQSVRTFVKQAEDCESTLKNAARRKSKARVKRFTAYISRFSEWEPPAQTNKTTQDTFSSPQPVPPGSRCFFPIESLKWEPNSIYLQFRYPQMVHLVPSLKITRRNFRRRSPILQRVQSTASSFEFFDSFEYTESDNGRGREVSIEGALEKPDVGVYLSRMREKWPVPGHLPPLEHIITEDKETKKSVTHTPTRKANKSLEKNALRPLYPHRISFDEMYFDKIMKKVDRSSTVAIILPLLPSFLESFRSADWLKATECFSAVNWPNCPAGQTADAFVTRYVNAALIRRLLALDGDLPARELFVDLFKLHSTVPLSKSTCSHLERIVLEVFIKAPDLSLQPKIKVLVFAVRLLISMGATDMDTFALLLYCLAVVNVLYHSDKDLYAVLHQSLEYASIPDTKGFLSDELRDMFDVRRILVPHIVDQTFQGDGETLRTAETQSLISFLREWLFHWIVDAKLRLESASSQQPDEAKPLITSSARARRIMDNNRRRKYPRGAIQEKTPLTAIDAIRAFYSWKGESLWVVVMQPPDTASEKTVTSHEVLVKPKEVLCRTRNRINTRTVDGKLPESVGFHDPCRPSFANPWRSYCQAMRNRLPPLMHFRPPVVVPMLFREPPQSLESLSQDIGRVRDQVASLVYWFLPELSRVLPCLRQDNSPARSDDDINTNVSPQWTISRKRVWFLRGEQSRLALTLEMDG